MTTRVWVQRNILMWRKPHILGFKNNWGMQSKIAFKICEGISCSSFYVKEFVVIVYKKQYPSITLLNFWPFCTPNHQRTWWLGNSHSHLALLEIYSPGTDVLVSSLSTYHIWKSSMALSSVMANWSYVMATNAETVSIWWRYHVQHVQTSVSNEVTSFRTPIWKSSGALSYIITN